MDASTQASVDAGARPAADAGSIVSVPTATAARAGAGAPPISTPTRTEVPELEPGTRTQFCAGHGSPVTLHSSTEARALECGLRLERKVFRYALCACQDIELAGNSVRVDAFDSRQGPYTSEQTGAAIGVKRALRLESDETRLLGSVTVGNAGVVSFTGSSLTIGGDLQTQADFDLRSASASARVRIARDAWFDADILGARPGAVRVGRAAYQTPNHVGASAVEAVNGAVQPRDFTLSEPCGCEGTQLLDVPALVEQARTLQDNDAAGVPTSLLANAIDTINRSVPCGRILLENVALAVGTAALTISGRSALFVAGDFVLGGTFSVELERDAELDVFVAGDVMFQGTTALGDPNRPSALRWYVGGQLSFSGSTALAAQFYAPHANVELPAGQVIYGSILANRIRVPAAAQVHYDRAVLDLGPACNAQAPGPCTDCHACPQGLACVQGSCAACSTDSDCCEPLICTAGRCGPLLLTPP